MSLPRRRSFARSAPTFILKWLKPALMASFVSWAIFSSEYPGGRKRVKASERSRVSRSVRSYRCDLAILQTSRRRGIFVVELMKKEGRQAASQRHTHPCERTMASRWSFVASFALRIARASSRVIASVIYLNVADLTSSSWRKKNKRGICKRSYRCKLSADAYRAHVHEQFPERLLAGPSVQIPNGVVHGASSKVNDALLGTDPK